MAPNSTIYIVRHAEGFHQHGADGSRIRDAHLTQKGKEQATRFSFRFPDHEKIDALVASPLTRTIQTALLAFEPVTKRGLKVVAVAEAQEATDDASDTGMPIMVLEQEFQNQPVDLSRLRPDWYEKSGINSQQNLRERAARMRQILWDMPEQTIALVAHGRIAHFFTGDVDENDEQLGGDWQNVECRKFTLQKKGDGLQLVETEDSLRERMPPN